MRLDTRRQPSFFSANRLLPGDGVTPLPGISVKPSRGESIACNTYDWQEIRTSPPREKAVYIKVRCCFTPKKVSLLRYIEEKQTGCRSLPGENGETVVLVESRLGDHPLPPEMTRRNVGGSDNVASKGAVREKTEKHSERWSGVSVFRTCRRVDFENDHFARIGAGGWTALVNDAGKRLCGIPRADSQSRHDVPAVGASVCRAFGYTYVCMRAASAYARLHTYIPGSPSTPVRKINTPDRPTDRPTHRDDAQTRRDATQRDGVVVVVVVLVLLRPLILPPIDVAGKRSEQTISWSRLSAGRSGNRSAFFIEDRLVRERYGIQINL